MDSIRILAITPPGSMDRVVSDLRAELFRRWGAVSSLALPSLIPVRSWPFELPRADAAGRLADAAGPLRLSLERYERVAGYLFLSVSGMEPALGRLAEHLGPSPPAAAEPFPMHPGFLLAGPDLDVSIEELAGSVAIPEERRFGSYAFSVIRVCSDAPREQWWDLVSWEEEVCVPVKGTGRAAPGSGARRPGSKEREQ